MAHDTIPAPSKGDIEIATAAVASLWDRTRGDNEERVIQLIRVMAQKNAELRWLHNILNKGVDNGNS